MIKIIKQKIEQAIANKYYADFKSFAVGYFITAFISFVIIYFVNKNLSSTELGRYSYYKTIFELSYTILSLTIYSSYLRFNLSGANKELYHIVMKVVILASIITSFIIFYFTKNIFCILFSLIIFVNERTYFFRSIMNVRPLNEVRIYPAIITLGLILFAVLFDKKLLVANNILIFYGIGYLIVFFFYKKNNFESKDYIRRNDIFKFILPGVGLVIVDWLLNLSAQVIIKKFYDYNYVAIFAVAQQSLLVIKLFSGLFLMFYPMIYFREVENKNRLFIRKSRILIILTTLLLIVFCFVFSDLIYFIMGAKKYVEYKYIFKILLVSEFFKILSSFYGLFLTYKIKVFQNFLILSFGSIVNIILMYLFLSSYGIVFAAYSILVSNMIVFLLFLVFSYRREQNFLVN